MFLLFFLSALPPPFFLLPSFSSVLAFPLDPQTPSFYSLALAGSLSFSPLVRPYGLTFAHSPRARLLIRLVWVETTAAGIKATDAPELTLHYGASTIHGKISTAPVTFATYNLSDLAFLPLAEADTPLKAKNIAGLLGLGFAPASLIATSLDPDPLAHPPTANGTASYPLLQSIFCTAQTTSNNFFTMALSRAESTNASASIGTFTIGEVDAAIALDREATPAVPVLSPLSNATLLWTVEMTALKGNDSVAVPLAPGNITAQTYTNLTSSCVALLASGSALNYAPNETLAELYKSASVPATYVAAQRQWFLPCDTPFHVTVQLAGQDFPIHPLDTSTPTTMTLDGKTSCRAAFQPINFQTSYYDVVLGAAFLKNVYSVFDLGDNPITGPASLKFKSLTDLTAATAEFNSLRAGGVKVPEGVIASVISNSTAPGTPGTYTCACPVSNSNPLATIAAQASAGSSTPAAAQTSEAASGTSATSASVTSGSGASSGTDAASGSDTASATTDAAAGTGSASDTYAASGSDTASGSSAASGSGSASGTEAPSSAVTDTAYAAGSTDTAATKVPVLAVASQADDAKSASPSAVADLLNGLRRRQDTSSAAAGSSARADATSASSGSSIAASASAAPSATSTGSAAAAENTCLCAAPAVASSPSAASGTAPTLSGTATGTGSHAASSGVVMSSGASSALPSSAANAAPSGGSSTSSNATAGTTLGLATIASHNTEKDAWILIDNVVYEYVLLLAVILVSKSHSPQCDEMARSSSRWR